MNAARCVLCSHSIEWERVMPEKCPSCGARGAVKATRVAPRPMAPSEVPTRPPLPVLARQLEEALARVAKDDSPVVD